MIFESAQELRLHLLREDCNYLWIFNPTKKPPHIGISADNEFYSLKFSGKDEAIPLKKILRAFKDKSILVLELSSFNIDSQKLQRSFQTFDKVKVGENTCLSPILNYLDIQAPFILPELLTFLKNANSIAKVFQLNLEGEIIMSQYNKADLQEKLSQLDAERR